jgi:hypothetical protein
VQLSRPTSTSAADQESHPAERELGELKLSVDHKTRDFAMLLDQAFSPAQTE